MQIFRHTLPSGAELTGYLRDETVEMPDYNIRPAILILPGGAYMYCSKRESDPVAVQFLQAGYQVFLLRYTCAPTPDKAPLLWQPLTDAAGAILYLRQNAQQLRLDPQRIAVCGFSAGGHLAASTALLAHAPAVQQALGITGDEARPNAVVLGYPVISTGPFGHAHSTENIAGSDPAILAQMSLENQVKPGLPPFFIWHTVTDEAVPVQNSLLLASALEENDVPYEMHLFAKEGHGTSTCTREVGTPSVRNHAWLSLCTGWLADIFDYHI